MFMYQKPHRSIMKQTRPLPTVFLAALLLHLSKQYEFDE
jgi:hypothetical protein